MHFHLHFLPYKRCGREELFHELGDRTLQSAASLRNFGGNPASEKRNVAQSVYRYLHMGGLKASRGVLFCFVF